MGKRSNFKRNERDFYPTPYEAIKPLLEQFKLKNSLWNFRNLPNRFYDPCAGDGALQRHMPDVEWKLTDIEPQRDDIEKKDIFSLTIDDVKGYTILTNPPWDRKILHPIIEHCMELKCPTWLLFDSDWMHTKQSIPYIKNCREIISVGRVKWIPESKYTGKENCCWYYFDRNVQSSYFHQHSTFIGRT